MSWPPPIKINVSDRVQTLWSERVTQHLLDSYAGVPLLKFPEDLRVYEHLLWETRSNVVIELGSHSGGSALWFRDRLRTFESYGRIRNPRVISVDVDIHVAQEAVGRVDPSFGLLTLLEADVLDESLPSLVESYLPADAVCLVIEDSAHTRETTAAALSGFSRFVHPGGFFVVEDGCVDVEELRVDPDWPRGVIPAIRDFLSSSLGADFVVRKDLEVYGLTCYVDGYLQRRSTNP